MGRSERAIGRGRGIARKENLPMATRGRKPPAPTARTGGMADLMAGDPNEIKGDLKREAPLHPQGAGGLDPAEDAGRPGKRRTRRRLARILR
jgi:hypothetical protein